MDENKQKQDQIFWDLYNQKKIQLAHFNTRELEFFDELQGGVTYAPSFEGERIRCYIDLAFVVNDPVFQAEFEKAYADLSKTPKSKVDNKIVNFISSGSPDDTVPNLDNDSADVEEIEELEANGLPYDNEIAWMPTDILNYFDSVIGEVDINPEDGLPQYSRIGKAIGNAFRFVREKVAPRALQAIGASVAGPVGATVGRYAGERIAGNKHKVATKKAASAGLSELTGNLLREYGGMGQTGQSIGSGLGEYLGNRWQGVNKDEALKEGLAGGMQRYLTSNPGGGYPTDQGSFMGNAMQPFKNIYSNTLGESGLLGSRGPLSNMMGGGGGSGSAASGGGVPTLDVFERAGMGKADEMGTSSGGGSILDTIKKTIFGDSSGGISGQNSSAAAGGEGGQLNIIERFMGKGNTLPGLAMGAMLFKGHKDEKRLQRKADEDTRNRQEELNRYYQNVRDRAGMNSKPNVNLAKNDRNNLNYLAAFEPGSREQSYFLTDEELEEQKKRFGYAKGGTVKKASPKFNGFLKGKGTGTSDSIPLDNLYEGGFVLKAASTRNLGSKKLNELVDKVLDRKDHILTPKNPRPIKALVSNGEFVFSPDFVTKLGNGSNKKGSNLLYKLQDSSKDVSRTLLEKLLRG